MVQVKEVQCTLQVYFQMSSQLPHASPKPALPQSFFTLHLLCKHASH